MKEYSKKGEAQGGITTKQTNEQTDRQIILIIIIITMLIMDTIQQVEMKENI